MKLGHHKSTEITKRPFKKYVTQGGWVGVVIFVKMRYEKYGGWGGLNVLRYVTQIKEIENALIDLAGPKNEWGCRCFDVPQNLNKSLTNLCINESN